MADKFVQGNWLLPNNANANKQSNYSFTAESGSARYFDFGTELWDLIKSSNEFSISWWCKIPSGAGVSGDFVPFNFGTELQTNVSQSQRLWLAMGGGSTIFKIRNNGTVVLEYSNPPNDVWTHYVFSVKIGSNTADQILYKDGQSVATTSSAITSISSSSSFFYINQYYRSNYTGVIGGSFDEYSFFTRALSSLEVGSLYNSGTPGNPFDLSGDPVAYYKLGETAVGQAPGGTWNWQIPNHAQSQFAMQATPPDAYSQIVTRYFDLGNTHTFSTWIKGTSNVGRFFLEGSPALNNNSPSFQDNIGILISNSTTINYRINGNNLTGTISPINDDEWHNIILVRTPTAAKVYIDGGSAINLTGTVASSENFNFKALTASYGAIGVGSWSGLVSNMVVWTSDRSSEVANIYNSGEPQSAYTTQPQYWYKLDNTTTFDPDFNTIRSVNSGSLSSDSYNVRSLMSQGSGPTGGLSLTFSTGNINLGTQNSISWWWSMPELYQYYNPTNFFAGDTGSNLVQWTRNTSSNFIRFTVYTGSSSSSVITFYRTDNTTLYDSMTDNNFHNYLLTRDGTNVSLYIDNNLIGTAAGTDANNNTLIEKIGGAYGGNSCCFKIAGGYYLDNFSFYNKVLSTSERATLYNSGNQSDISSLSPVYWFNADNIDTTNNNFIDLTGGSNLLPSPSNVVSYVFNNGASIGGHSPLGTLSLQSTDLGLHNPLYSQFSMRMGSPGTADKIETNYYMPNGTSSRSLSFWINNQDATWTTAGYSNSIVLGGDNNSGNGTQFSIGILGTNYGGYFWLRTNGGINSGIDTAITAANTGTLSTKQWYHFGVTYDNSRTNNLHFYLNGVKIQETNNTNINTNTTFPVSMQGQPSLLSNVAIWEKAITDADMSFAYNNGKPSDISSLNPKQWWRLDNAYTNSANKYVLPNSADSTYDGLSNQVQRPEVSANAPKVVAPGVSSGLVELDKKGDSPNSTSNSISYNILKTDQSIYTPKYVGDQIANNFSMKFDGVDGFFNIGSGVDFAGKNFTISGWYKITKSSGSSSMFSMGSSKNIGIWHDGNNVVFNTKTDTASWSGIQAAMAKNTWKHVAFTYDGSYQTIYIDGVQAVQGAKTGLQQDDGTDQWIGYLSGVSSYAYEGQIDEVSIFDKALTADQIKFDLYQPSLPSGSNKTADIENNTNLPTPVAWYRMGD